MEKKHKAKSKYVKKCNILAERIKQIAKEHKAELDALSVDNAGDSTNAKGNPDWVALGISGISRAARIAGIPTRRYWNNNPGIYSIAIPSCLYPEVVRAYCAIFNRQELKIDIDRLPIVSIGPSGIGGEYQKEL